MKIFSDGWVKQKRSTSSLKWFGHAFHVSATNIMTMSTGEYIYYYAINHSPSGISNYRILT